MSDKVRPRTLILLLIPLIPLLPLLASPGGLLIWPGADVSDLVTAHMPAASFVNYSWLEWRQIPLWNPTILSGMPTLGDPLVGLAYPPLWLTYVIPTSATFHLLLWLHLIWAGLGMFKLARAQGLSQESAWLAGLALALAPRVLGQWGLGHVTLVFAFSWTPWLLWALQRAVTGTQDQAELSWRWFALAGAFLGLLASVDPRWAAPAAMLAAGLAVYLLLSRQETVGWRSAVAGGLVLGLVTLGAAAFLGIPLLTLLDNSQRATIDVAELARTAMPAAALLQLIVPNPSVWPEWGASMGAGVLVLAALGIASSSTARFWGGAALAALVLSLGPATPVWQTLVLAVPGLDLLRMPGRWFLIVSLAGPMMAAFGAQAWLSQNVAGRRRLNLTAFGAGGLVIALAVVRLLALESIKSPAALAAIAAILVVVVLLAIILSNRRQSPAGLVLGGIVIAELVLFGLMGLEVRTIENSLSPAVVAELPSGYGGGRVFSPSFSYSQLEATEQQMEAIEGVHPLQLRAYRSYLARAFGFQAESYSVTLPPLPPDGIPTEPYLDISVPALELLAASHVVSDYPLEAAGLTELTSENGHWLYAVDRPRPRAWLEPTTSEQGLEWLDVSIQLWSPNRLEILAEGPGRLVLSEIQYPSWQATVDGLPVLIEREDGLFRAIPIAAGQHRVILQARPGLGAWLGLGISMLTWLAVGLIWWRQ